VRSDDELEALRAAWEWLEAPEPDRALDEPDEATRAAVEWMRSAWAALEPPPVEVPAPSASRVEPSAQRRWPMLGALAALLAALVAAGLWAGLERPAQRGTRAVVGVLTGPSVEPEASGALEPADELDASSPAAREDARSSAVQVAALSEDQMELRSGPVRLILLTNTARADGARERDDR
jgi:hypothetical protein